ncbi:MAG: MBOAT family protein [Desulfovibrio sp.]|jgi:alginate O-acetyltransferase complex protein AlgI|nr:MBOAT family protein [Desulfovibrio sp.]
MLFNSYSFLFCFLPLLVLAAHMGKRLGTQWPAGVLLVFSLVFYGLAGSGFLLMLIGLVAVNCWIGHQLARPDGEIAQATRGRLDRKGALVLTLVLNLLPLVWFKYSGFLAQNLSLLLGTHLDIGSVGLPLGISFYTFIQIAWIMGVYQRKFQPPGLFRHVLFSSFFPYVISGPIVRYEQMGPQFDAFEGPDADGMAKGLSLFSMGLAKKIIMADSLAVYANYVFNAADGGLPLTGGEAWLGSLAYTFQLYFDFSGYTDMALGLGLMLGLKLPENFDSPYKSTGIVDFWRRWHITLGVWLRDFLYIPLGGNRAGKLKQYRNLFLTMFIGGIWHGAGWTFMIWGALHGLMLAINHYFRALIKGRPIETILRTLPFRCLFIFITFLLINGCWVVFRATTLEGAMRIYGAMVAGGNTDPELVRTAAEGLTGWAAWVATYLPNGYFQGWTPFVLLGASLLICWFLPNSRQMFNPHPKETPTRFLWKPSTVWATCLALLVFASLILASRKSTFLYFQF